MQKADPQVLIGRTIRALREQAGMTLEQLASKAAISYQYLSTLENGHENFTIGVLDSIAKALKIPLRSLVALSFDQDGGAASPKINPAYFRRNVPLPGALTFDAMEAALNRTQSVFFSINRNMKTEIGRPLQELIQGNNYSGLVSNVLCDSFDQTTCLRHNHHQKYPDLVCGTSRVGVEVKSTIQIGKGGESHNGHSGWHLIACFESTPSGIEFIHVMLGELKGHLEADADWTYVGSKVNEKTGSRRTETFNTTLQGTTKLRDGTVYLDPRKIDYSRWRQSRTGAIPPHSIFAKSKGF